MSQLTTDDGTRVHYRIHGDGERTVVLVHGWMTSGAVWDDLLAKVQPGTRYVVPDLRGTGASDAPDGGYTLARMAADVVALATHLELDRYVVVGHSMGGQVAQLVALEDAARVVGLALLCGVPASGMKLPDEAHALFFNAAGNEGMLGTILDLACKQLSPASRERMVAIAQPIGAPCIQGVYEAWTGGGFADRIAAIEVPTLVLATSDPFLPPPFLQEASVDPIPRAHLAVLEGPGHYPQVEAPGPTAAVLEAFLAGAYPAR